MRILGIETSCDETSASIVEDGTKILSNVVASSVEMHTKTGGIIPENAARQQITSIIPVIQEALASALGKSIVKSQLSKVVNKVDSIAVTVGPGLIGSLLVGVETAKTLSYLWQKPIVPINHLLAHLYANWLSEDSLLSNYETMKQYNNTPKFPALSLIVSGGHTNLVLMKNHGQIKSLGGTRDDAAGECFDKCARLLDLPYPGGPSISKQSYLYFSRKPKTVDHKLSLFPRPMLNSNDFDFSFSGLKTSVLREVEKIKTRKQWSNETIEHLSAEIQEAIVDVLASKSLKAIEKFKPKSFLLSGGVAANQRLREKLRCAVKNMKFCEFHVAPAHLCTDNAAPIASCAYFNYNPTSWTNIAANPQLTVIDNQKP